jgi:hypothetical protein
MITPPVSLQDLRRRINVTAKADSAGRGGVRHGSKTGLGLFGGYWVRYGAVPESAPRR